MTFERFMELALYCPEYGYYEKIKDRIGRDGDFLTSVSVGNLFGEILAIQFARWIREWDFKATIHLVETGAHDGTLGGDILNWLQTHESAIFQQVIYWVLEPSPGRQAVQKKTLAEFAGQVRWTEDLASLRKLEPAGITGIIFSNELLDALPVHRLGWDANSSRWFEWGIKAINNGFEWSRPNEPFEPSPRSKRVKGVVRPWDLPEELLAVLPDGISVEFGEQAEQWWDEAGQLLTAGKLMTIDYGIVGDGIPAPENPKGTLRGYRDHRYVENLLETPGEIDLTAHINFSDLKAIGEQAGLKTDFLGTQAHFLTRVVAETPTGKGGENWTAAQRRQFQTLTHPEHFGRAFRVLIQSR